MSNLVQDNAVVRRLGWLSAQYSVFSADPLARLLRWVIEDDERRMIDAFVATENDGRLKRLPDLFVALRSPFEHAERHGWTLLRELDAQYEQACAHAVQSDAKLQRWAPPALLPDADDVDALAEVSASFAEHHDELLEHLTLVLQPGSIVDRSDWCAWLVRVVRRLPERVRVIVLDHDPAPGLDVLDVLEPQRVITRKAALDMDGAYLELSDGRAEDRSPASDIRRGFVRMMIAGKHGNVEAAVAIGTPALQRAARERAWDLAATLQLAMGSLYHAHGQSEAAHGCFVQAEVAAERSASSGDIAGHKLRLQARMAEGSTLMQLERWREAARAYQHAAGLAEAQGDILMAHDAWRLAGYAHEQGREADDAWRCGARALRLGESMLPVERRCSTLPYTGEALLRLAEQGAPPDEVELPRSHLSEHLDTVLGPDWRATA